MPEERKPPDDAKYRPEVIEAPPFPKTLFELFDLIRMHPAMWLGRKSLRDLNLWIDGYDFALRQVAAPLRDDGEFGGFDAFVCDKYHWHDVGGWAAKIMYYYRDEAQALDKFFELLDEFRAMKAAKIKC